MSRFFEVGPLRTRSFRFQLPADLCTAWALEMETLILGWYVLTQTGSVFLLTLFGALLFGGTLATPLLGTLGDRLGLRRVLSSMRLAYAALAFVILLLTLTGRLTPVLVLVMAGLASLIRTSDIGIRSALIGATVPAQHFVAAMGLSRTTSDSAKIAGALVGASVFALFGMASAYAAICLIHLLGAVLTLQVDAGHAKAAQEVPEKQAAPTAQRPSPWHELKEGLHYVWQTPQLLAAMCVAALVNLTAFPFTAGLMPYIARDVFALDQRGLSWMVASFATGALLGSLLMSVLGTRFRPARAMLVTCVIWHLCLLVFVMTPQWHSIALAMLALVAAGAAQSIAMLTLSIILLRTSEPRFRGRIMGVRMLAIYPLPVGLLIAGGLIPQIGFVQTAALLLVSGLLLLAAIALRWRGDLLKRDGVGNAGAVVA
jgi:Na+/melibiose symporter-like transporter